jgi:hypothetical protein
MERKILERGKGKRKRERQDRERERAKEGDGTLHLYITIIKMRRYTGGQHRGYTSGLNAAILYHRMHPAPCV